MECLLVLHICDVINSLKANYADRSQLLVVSHSMKNTRIYLPMISLKANILDYNFL
jgi:hypothetical protein